MFLRALKERLACERDAAGPSAHREVKSDTHTSRLNGDEQACGVLPNTSDYSQSVSIVNEQWLLGMADKLGHVWRKCVCC